jgi:hypothetical protein
MRTQSCVLPKETSIGPTDFSSCSKSLSRFQRPLLIQGIRRKLNFAFPAIISFIMGFLTVYGGWSYTQIELWLANGFLKWYIWKVAKLTPQSYIGKIFVSDAHTSPIVLRQEVLSAGNLASIGSCQNAKASGISLG